MKFQKYFFTTIMLIALIVLQVLNVTVKAGVKK